MSQPKHENDKFVISGDRSESNVRITNYHKNNLRWMHGDKVLGTLSYHKISDKRHRVTIDYEVSFLKQLMNENVLKMLDLNDGEPGDLKLMHPLWWDFDVPRNKIVPKNEEGIPEEWTKAGKQYGRIEAKTKASCDIKKKRLIDAFNDDLAYIHSEHIGKNKIIDIPKFEERSLHRYHYMVQDKPRPSREWFDACEEIIEDRNCDNPCKICQECYPRLKEGHPW